MRRIALAAAVAIAASGTAVADYEDGMQAYHGGDYRTAFNEFEDAANKGDTAAQYMLGDMYAHGLNVTQNYVNAHKWYSIAATWGHDRAPMARSRLESRMYSYQIAQARTMAENWRPAGSQIADDSPAFTVRNAQMLLNRIGYVAGPEDGVMGTKTRLAIRAYQRDRGLSADGQLTPTLFARMVTDSDKGSSSAAGDDRTQLIANIQSELRLRGYTIPLVTGELDDGTRQAIWAYQRDSGVTVDGKPSETLLARLRSSQGNDRNDMANVVHAIQSRLNDLGYNAGPEDGVYGPTMRSAVREFQSDQGLPVTGEASESLLSRIQQAIGESADKDERYFQLVLATQRALEARGYAVGEVNGKVTSQTTAAVRTYQSDAGLMIDGRIDGDLLQRLERTEEQGARQVAEMTRAQVVQEIQRSLNQRGYNAGPSDGVFGPGTRVAILAYQADAGLPQTGEASRHLQRHLRSSGIVAGTGAGQTLVSSAQLNQEIKVELNRLGYDVGDEDGQFNDRTRQGILAFQKESRVEQTGEPTPALLAQLQNSYRAQGGTGGSEVIRGIAADLIDRLSLRD